MGHLPVVISFVRKRRGDMMEHVAPFVVGIPVFLLIGTMLFDCSKRS